MTDLMRDSKRVVFDERLPIVFPPIMNQRERRMFNPSKAIRGISKKSLEGDFHDR